MLTLGSADSPTFAGLTITDILLTTADGIDVLNTAAAATLLDVVGSGANQDGIFGARGDSGGVRFKWDEGLTAAEIKQTDAAGTTEEDVWIRMVDNDAVFLFFNGNARLETTLLGAEITGTSLDLNNDPSGGTGDIMTRNSNGGVALSSMTATGSGRITQRTNLGAVQDTWIDMVRDGAVSLFENNTVRLATTTLGIDVLGSELDLDNSGSANSASLRIRNSEGSFVITEDTDAAAFYLGDANGTSGLEPFMIAFGDGAVDVYHNGTVMTRTVVIGSGGLEVNNTVTGAGFERVLTTGDKDVTYTNDSGIHTYVAADVDNGRIYTGTTASDAWTLNNSLTAKIGATLVVVNNSASTDGPTLGAGTATVDSSSGLFVVAMDGIAYLTQVATDVWKLSGDLVP